MGQNKYKIINNDFLKVLFAKMITKKMNVLLEMIVTHNTKSKLKCKDEFCLHQRYLHTPD